MLWKEGDQNEQRRFLDFFFYRQQKVGVWMCVWMCGCVCVGGQAGVRLRGFSMQHTAKVFASTKSKDGRRQDREMMPRERE